MPLQSYWQTSLPGSGHDVTSTLISGTNVYAACNGHVYRLDLTSGKVLQEKNLPGYGENEIRLAISETDSTLIVGIVGYVVALDSTSLTPKWTLNVGASDANVVNVLVKGADHIAYASSSGSIYAFHIPTGVVKSKVDFPNIGKYEARLALAWPTADMVFVGINGWAIALRASDFTILWEKSLPGSGYAVTTVAGGEGRCFAICNGYLYMLEASTGRLGRRNDLSGTGKAESQLALRGDGGVLFVGVNGYGVAVRASDISTIYLTSLPGCGYNLTHVVAGKVFAYFGCNGYLYSVDESGAIVNTNALPGLGKHQTRITLDVAGGERLVAGINGYAVGLLCTPPFVVGPWMANRAVTIGPKKLREIAIPGSHLSGTYAVSPLKPWQTGRYLPRVLYLVWELRLPRKIEEIVLTMWTLAQPDNFLTQLNAGIRYFDLQIQGVVNGAPMCFVYGLESAPVTELFSQLSAFLSTKGNEKEVVLLNFSYTYDMTWSDTVDLLNSFVNTFSDSLAVYNPNGSNKGGLDGFNLDAKLNELWATSARVIIFYSNPDALEKYNFLWPRRSTISSSYPEEATFADVKAVLDNLLPFKEDLFFVLQCQVTPDLDVIKSGVAGSYASLGALAQAGNPLIVKWLNGWGPHKGINIVLADWMTLYPELVSTVIGLNDHTSSVNALVGTNSDTEMEQAPPIALKTTVDGDRFVKSFEDGSISMVDVINHTYAEAFRVLGHNPSQQNVETLMKLQEYVENDPEIKKHKLPHYSEVVHEPTAKGGFD